MGFEENRLDFPAARGKVAGIMENTCASTNAAAVSPTYEEVAERLRAKYKKHTPEQRKIYGDEPSEGTILGELSRIQCDNLTEEEESKLLAHAMSVIYGAAAKPHAGHATCS